MKRFSFVFSALMLVWLVACSAPSEPPTPSTTGTISGTILGTGVTSRPLEIPADAEYVPGEVIVAFMDDEPGDVRVAGMELQSLRTLSLPGTSLFSTGSADPAEVAALLSMEPGVRYAQPNYIMRPMQVGEPNDQIWNDSPAYFWNYRAINVPEAWNITTGTGSVVAVIDSGIVVDQVGRGRPSHEDLVESVVQGYDFISDPRVAADGNGRDKDPYDPGGNPGSEPRYHGTHVAGTIGATTNNEIGIPGIGWDTKILPVRALGHGGGTLVDIMEGAMWAAGIEIAGVPDIPDIPDNQYPADVLNMSLGAAGQCSGFIREALHRITTETNAIPVVAAGNEGQDVANVTPANCPHVITVAATGYIPGEPGEATLASYSNYGNRVDIAAPGGAYDIGPNGVRGILSTWADENTGAPEYASSRGTSMAAPHVSGVIALMKSLRPDLRVEEVRAILRNTATPLACTGSCGAGLINASAALEQLDLPGSGPSAAIEISPYMLDFWVDTEHMAVTITNTLSSTAQVDIHIVPGWLTGPTAVTVAGLDTEEVAFTVNRDVLTNGTHAGDIEFRDYENGDLLGTVYVLVDKRDQAASPTGKAMYLLSWVPDPDAPDGWADSAFYCEDTPFNSFRNVNALPGKNMIAAFIDIDGNRDLSDGDWLGMVSGTVRVITGQQTIVPTFTVAPYAGSQQHLLEIPEARVRSAIQTAVQKECQWGVGY